MQQLSVALGDRAYPIYVGENILGQPELFSKHIHGSQVLVVTNEAIAKHYLAPLKNSLSPYNTEYLLLPDGEKYKTLDTLNLIFSKLLELKFDRKCTLVALGGGVIGDITGFAAATFVRGVDFIQVPTTLLAQVDSSVGGKTAVNHPLGKNMIGAFHQPNCVIADTATLKTLPERELLAGLAEVIKYGLINDVEFFKWIKVNKSALLDKDSDALTYCIKQSCADKAGIVAEDEKESGARALLNLGHTFGHAIEAGLGYGEWLHGEAISAGMVMAFEFAASLGRVENDDVNEVRSLLSEMGLPVEPPAGISVEQFIGLMMRDKKVQDGVLRLVLPSSLGRSEIVADVSSEKLSEYLSRKLSG